MPTPFTTLFSEYAAVADRISRSMPRTSSYQAGLCLTDAGRGQMVLRLRRAPEIAPVVLTPTWETPAEGVAHIRRLRTFFLSEAAFSAVAEAAHRTTISQARMARPALSHPDAEELEHMAYTPFIAWCAARAERRPATITFWGFCSWEAEICAYNGEIALWNRFWFTTSQALTALALSCDTSYDSLLDQLRTTIEQHVLLTSLRARRCDIDTATNGSVIVSQAITGLLDTARGIAEVAGVRPEQAFAHLCVQAARVLMAEASPTEVR